MLLRFINIISMNISKKVFRKKSIESLLAESQSSTGLERSISVWQLLIIGIGAIVGAGIFVLTGKAACFHAGPAVILSFLVGGIACVCAAFCYAELASTIPLSGSAYTYMYAAFGELPAYITAGLLMMGNFLSVSAVAIGWSGYFTSILSDFGIHIPAIFANPTGAQVYDPLTGDYVTSVINLPTLCVCLFVTIILYSGLRSFKLINLLSVISKTFVLLLFVIIGLYFIDMQNLSPFIPENTGRFGEFGISGIIAGASMIFLAYNGFDNIASAAQEAKNPQRSLPIAIIGSILISAAVYGLVSFVLVGIVSYKELGVAEPIAVAVNKIGMQWFATLIKFGSITGLMSVILVMSYGIIRVMYSMSIDGLLPKALSRIHKKNKVPHIATLFVGICISVTASTAQLTQMVHLGNLGILLTFIIVCLATVFLRYSRPDLDRKFKCPFMPFLPLFGVCVMLWLVYSMPSTTYLYAFLWLLCYSAIYFTYGVFHSKLRSKK